jgi:alanine dehydrogenase
MPIILDCADNGGIESLLQLKPGIRNGVYVYKGCVTSAAIAKRFGKKYTNLELLMANPL